MKRIILGFICTIISCFNCFSQTSDTLYVNSVETEYCAKMSLSVKNAMNIKYKFSCDSINYTITAYGGNPSVIQDGTPTPLMKYQIKEIKCNNKKVTVYTHIALKPIVTATNGMVSSIKYMVVLFKN